MKKLGFLGPKGSFSEEAVHLLLATQPELSDSAPELIPYSTIPRLLFACNNKEIDWAFVPLENSTEGQVGVTMDTLAQTEHLYITREFVHPIDQCLLAHEPMPLEQIERVYSHEQAIGQCRDFLEKFLPNAQQITCLSTAEAAHRISSIRENWAAIGPRRAARLYNLHILKECIQDATLNATRFVLVGHSLAEMSDGEDKTSLLVIAENTPGSLYRILGEFAKRHINLSRIESRPSKRKLGEYVFFVDVDGYVFAPPIQDVLWSLKKDNISVKLLGSYPKALPHEQIF
ncbi:prephenate dehydratase [Desulfosporosinus orientis DSM 765]|uniref:Prephenate dehydratase n=1 Tax=Desulfosporosinus orientis (strain ATCC 19365 / DSM 765 / NCIMB 8382 / VKM B-1628 / Singapore I) TaxID=768706 RepID=G7WFN3_DESOD|nr:prephenate dehydratase [Desulfosporosinus orientis]AET68906.1 prephenate dehydratase [Desulfosporosinus orientis DSM 765]